MELLERTGLTDPAYLILVSYDVRIRSCWFGFNLICFPRSITTAPTPNAAPMPAPTAAPTGPPAMAPIVTPVSNGHAFIVNALDVIAFHRQNFGQDRIKVAPAAFVQNDPVK